MQLANAKRCFQPPAARIRKQQPAEHANVDHQFRFSQAMLWFNQRYIHRLPGVKASGNLGFGSGLDQKDQFSPALAGINHRRGPTHPDNIMVKNQSGLGSRLDFLIQVPLQLGQSGPGCLDLSLCCFDSVAPATKMAGF